MAMVRFSEDTDDMVEPESDTIGGRISQIRNYLQYQEEILAKLEERMSPVLTPEAPELGMAGGEKEASDIRRQSDVAEQLESYARRIDRNNHRINRLAARFNL